MRILAKIALQDVMIRFSLVFKSRVNNQKISFNFCFHFHKFRLNQARAVIIYIFGSNKGNNNIQLKVVILWKL